jgi:hypothetical protein
MNASVRHSHWRWGVATIAAAGVVVPAAIAWACVAVVSLTVSPQSIQPGGTVAVTARDTAPGAPIEIHLDSPTGRLLATHPAHNNSVMQNSWTENVPIPGDVSPGEHVLVATQDYHNMNAGVPARATIFVGQPAGSTPTVARPSKVEVSTGPSLAAVLLTGLGVAALALIVAAVWYGVASRRPRGPEAQPART